MVKLNFLKFATAKDDKKGTTPFPSSFSLNEY